MKTTEFIEKLNQLDFISEVTESSELKQITIFVNYRMTVTIATEELFTFNLMQAGFNQLVEEDQITLYKLTTEYVATPLDERANSRVRLDVMEDELKELLDIPGGFLTITHAKVHDGTICVYLKGDAMLFIVDEDEITLPSSNGEGTSIPIDKLLTVVTYIKDHLDELHELWVLSREEQNHSHNQERKQERKSVPDEDSWDEWKKVIDEYWGEWQI